MLNSLSASFVQNEMAHQGQKILKAVEKQNELLMRTDAIQRENSQADDVKVEEVKEDEVDGASVKEGVTKQVIRDIKFISSIVIFTLTSSLYLWM